MTRICLCACKQSCCQYAVPLQLSDTEGAESQKRDVRPYLDATFVRIADDVHFALGELDDAFLLQFFNRLDDALYQVVIKSRKRRKYLVD